MRLAQCTDCKSNMVVVENLKSELYIYCLRCGKSQKTDLTSQREVTKT